MKPLLPASFPCSPSLVVRWKRKLELKRQKIKITGWDKSNLLETGNEIRKQMVAVTVLITACTRKEANDSHRIAHHVESDITPKQKGPLL